MKGDTVRRVVGWTLIASGTLMVGLALAAGVLYWRTSGDGHEAGAQMSVGDPASMAGIEPGEDAGVGAVQMLEGALGELIGDPDPDRIPFCDDRYWPHVGDIVTSVDPTPEAADHDGVAMVHFDAWAALSTNARTGVASWASKCSLDGGRVIIRDTRTGVDLDAYDASSGLRSAGPSSKAR